VQHHDKGLGWIGLFRGEFKEVVETDQGEIITPYVHELAFALDGLDLGLRWPDGLVYDGQGDGEHLIANLDHHAVYDRQRERQLHPEGGALALLRGYLDASPEILDIALHHIHTYPSARELAHLLGSGEARGEEHVEDLLFGIRSSLFRLALFDSLGKDLLLVYALAVV